MTPALAQIGNRLLEPSAGQQPASGYYGGVLYLFSIENGVMMGRPCAATSSMLSGRENYAGYPIAGVADSALPALTGGSPCSLSPTPVTMLACQLSSMIPSAAIALFFYTTTPPSGPWMPASGQWTMVANAGAELMRILARNPEGVGAYAWDGRSMNFLSFPLPAAGGCVSPKGALVGFNFDDPDFPTWAFSVFTARIPTTADAVLEAVQCSGASVILLRHLTATQLMVISGIGDAMPASGDEAARILVINVPVGRSHKLDQLLAAGAAQVWMVATVQPLAHPVSLSSGLTLVQTLKASDL